MAQIVNLRMVRKARTRASSEQAAAEARALHGRSKGERAQATARNDALRRTVDGARLRKDGAEPAEGSNG